MHCTTYGSGFDVQPGPYTTCQRPSNNRISSVLSHTLLPDIYALRHLLAFYGSFSTHFTGLGAWLLAYLPLYETYLTAYEGGNGYGLLRIERRIFIGFMMAGDTYLLN